ncbi:hypothetical protein TH63_15965 [Rufibacter radiotolerans]|uniref:Aspartyl protease n=1 Tax=Rufibacter radiotolerans TaxID=1379910 RepID=A0A0H4VSM9_9BACT|nr:hypothetical protein [Rufibacter radiotolerans]AKQ46779.1 hypothetical protein TH63_15965 [Rufibacter radiotolerans]
MKLLKRILLSFLLLLVVISAGGYVYFKNKFEVGPSQLRLVSQPLTVPFLWKSNGAEPHAFQLIPVTLHGCPKTFYLQFDTGSPYTIFYQAKLETIEKKYGPATVPQVANGQVLQNFSFQVGSLPLTASALPVKAIGDGAIDWADTTSIEVIGTLGTDFIQDKVLVLDYKKSLFSVYDQFPPNLARGIQLLDFQFNSRRILLPGQINGKETALMFDSGSSAYELLTDKSTWLEMQSPHSPVDTAYVNSWGKTITAFTTTTTAEARFGQVRLPLRKATYLEGMSLVNQLLTAFSGLGGMTGNKLFLGHTLVLDTRHQKFAVLP